MSNAMERRSMVGEAVPSQSGASTADRLLLAGAVLVCLGLLAGIGCRGYSYGHLIKNNQPDMVGSHTAGAEVFNPLIDESVARLLGAQDQRNPPMPGLDGAPVPRTVCFVGVENKSAEDLGDFKDQIYEQIDTQITRSTSFRVLNRRVVDAALKETRMRPEDLFIKANMRLFTAILERDGQPVDYLLFAKLTSGSTERNSSTQRDYLLTLELVDTENGDQTKEQASVRKGYHNTYIGKAWNYNPLKAWK
jgi:hypothetical protein